MAHQSLYRAYRPHTFDDVAGQEQIVSALQAQLASGTVGHAYLFAGSRGLGKTSVARIFASALKVEDRDLYEIDAASNNGVDHMRDLAENVYTLPFSSPYKLYILDEAHMLSKSAWNAFLKTLEEPPAHAIFILATTELDKIPDTVQSRCQVFTFKKPTRAGLAATIASVAAKEGFAVEPAASDLLALLADGSYRDGLSVLEKALSAADGKTLTLSAAERATGAPRSALVFALIKALSAGDTNASLSAIAAARGENVDMQLFLTLVLEHLRQVLLVRHAPDMRRAIEAELGPDLYAEVSGIAGAASSLLTHQTLKAFLDAASRIRYAPVPSLPLELAVLELAR